MHETLVTNHYYFFFSLALSYLSTCIFFEEIHDTIYVLYKTLVSLSLADSQVDRNFGGKKPSFSGNEGPSLVESSGYNPKRQEFDPEYDNDAEQLLAEMEFKDTDTDEERELKLRVLRIYSKR